MGRGRGGAKRGDDSRFEGGALCKGVGGVFFPLCFLAGDDGAVRVGLGGALGDGGGGGVGNREVDVEGNTRLRELPVDVGAVFYFFIFFIFFNEICMLLHSQSSKFTAFARGREKDRGEMGGGGYITTDNT